MTQTLAEDLVIVNEKRKHPRFPVGLSLDINASGTMLGKCRGTIADVSATGMTFKTNAELEEGMHVLINLNATTFRGEVRHVQGAEHGGLHRYGVRFHKIDFDSQRGSMDTRA